MPGASSDNLLPQAKRHRAASADERIEPAPDTVAEHTVEAVALQGWLVLAVALASALGLAAEALRRVLPPTLVHYFSLSAEANLPTWFSSSLLLASAFAAGAIARTATHKRRYWWGIAVALGCGSIDRATGIHASFGDRTYIDGCIALALLIAVAWMWIRFVRSLPRSTRTGLAIAAVLGFTGAVAMQLPLAWWTRLLGTDWTDGALVDWVGGTLEMSAAAIALLVLLRHRAPATSTD
jgi:hypothetical protein